jgi:hypothetical protein
MTMAKTVETESSTPDAWPGLLDHYRETAVRILGSHLCSGSTCTSCGNPWPCRPACAAEIALEL